MHVCGVIEYTSLFKLNELSSRYSRFSTSRLEIRDSAGERNRSITRDGKYRAKGSRILRYFFRLYFVRLRRFRSHRFGGKSDMTNSMIKPVRSHYHLAIVMQKRSSRKTHRMRRAAKVLSLLRSPKRLGLMLAFL